MKSLKHWYWNVVPYEYRPRHLLYRFKCWAWRRYTTVKPRYLPHTWCDRVEVLPHMMFEILSQFVERELDQDDIRKSEHIFIINGVETNVREEIDFLYNWWHDDYRIGFPAAEDALWKEVEKYRPVHKDIPLDEDGNICDEKDADYFEWKSEFESEEQEEKYDGILMQINRLEEEQNKKLIAMMHRLVDLTPYLWT